MHNRKQNNKGKQMKKRILWGLFCVAILFTSCASSKQVDSSTELSGDVVYSSLESSKAETDKVDVDLTKLSSIMLYSEVSAIALYPEEYDQKTLRIKGTVWQYRTPFEPDKDCFGIMVTDATGCCQQGIQFILKEEEYPSIGSEITIQGKLETYKQGEMSYCRLIEAEIQ